MKNKHSLQVKEAYNSFKKKRYSDVIILLERLISSRLRDPYPYFLLSLSYLLTNRFSEADLMLKKIKMIDPEFLPGHQLESFIILKSAASFEIVLSKYIDILEKYPNDKYLNRALNALRREKDFSRFQSNARLKDFVYLPKRGKRRLVAIKEEERKRYLTKIVVFTVIALVLITIIAAITYLSFIQKTKEYRNKDQIDLIYLDGSRYDLIDKIKKEKTPIFYYSNEEVLRDFNKAKHLIKKDEYNRALILLNKILNSNANFRVKERVEFLRKFILNVEDRKYSIISFREVSQKPYLYRGLFIKWKGRVANLKRKDHRLLLNLLVDYKKNDIFTGIIDVYSEKYPNGIKNGDIVEVDAVFVYTIGGDNRMYLVAKNINQLM